MSQFKDKIIKALLATGLTSSIAVSGWYLTAVSEAPNGSPILNTYLDTGNVVTACLGATRGLNGDVLKMGKRYTEEECVEMFVNDYIEHQKLMRTVYKGSFVSGWEEAAVIDFVFNKGIGNFKSSTILRLLNEGRHREACDQLTKWIYGKNKEGKKVVIKGLINRASKEYKFCIGEVPTEAKQMKELIDSGGFK